jgi:ubiquinone/menaquinone biosynthesis C-methylase UbiE
MHGGAAFLINEIPSTFFDKDYFITGRKGHYGYHKNAPYTNPIYLQRSRQLARALDFVFQPKKVLDIGCAMGYLVQAFREINIEAYGLDKSEWAIKHANKKLEPFLYCGDSSDLSRWRDNQFDLITSWNSLEHIPLKNLLLTINEMSRVSLDSIAINIAITNDGHDKSHVSIFPVPWWKQQFEIFSFKLAWQKIHNFEWECNSATLFFVRRQREFHETQYFSKTFTRASKNQVAA